MTQHDLSAPENALITAAEPPALTTAIRVGQELLAHYGDSSRAGFSYPEAYGATREALRLLLRALGAEADGTSEGWTATMAVRLPGAAKGTQIVGTPGGHSEWLGSSRSGGTHGSVISRCPAAHPEDPTPCDGPPVVTALDATNAGADGCEHHAARLLASLDSGRVYPLPDAPDGAAIRVFKAADGIRPFPWIDAPRTRPEALSRKENREAGELQ